MTEKIVSYILKSKVKIFFMVTLTLLIFLDNNHIEIRIYDYINIISTPLLQRSGSSRPLYNLNNMYNFDSFIFLFSTF